MIGALLCLFGRHAWHREWYDHNPAMRGDGYPICDRCRRCRATRNCRQALNGETP